MDTSSVSCDDHILRQHQIQNKFYVLNVTRIKETFSNSAKLIMCLFNSCFEFIAYLNTNQSNSKSKLDDTFVLAMVREYDKNKFDAHVLQNICIFACMFLQSNTVTPRIPFGIPIA